MSLQDSARQLLLLWVCKFLLTVSPVAAAPACSGHVINPVRDICWQCLFPLTIGRGQIAHSPLPDTDNPKQAVCSCPGAPLPRVGLSLGFWEPMALVDVTRSPMCFVNLGGFSLPATKGIKQRRGEVDVTRLAQTGAFYHVHWYHFPLLSLLNLTTGAACQDAGGFDVGYLSELDPAWAHEDIAMLLYPETTLFSKPSTHMACAGDALAANAHLPLNKLFWCAGSQGAMYPLVGRLSTYISGIQASTHLAERAAFLLHRTGLLWDSVGSVRVAGCGAKPTLIMPKNRYRYQMVNPTATVGPKGCHPFGRTTATWQSKHSYPGKGRQFGYLIWRKRNCCAW